MRRKFAVTDKGITTDLAESTTDEEKEDEERWNIPRHEYRKMKRSLHRKRTQTRENIESGGFDPRRRRKPPVIGTGEGGSLKAAQPLRTITLFISRLQPDIASEVLLGHVSRVAGVTTVECEQVEQRYSHYRSFRVTIKAMPQNRVKDLYSPENWDKDILVRRWYDKINK